LVTVSGNYQRLRCHRFDPIRAQTIQIHVTATNGDDCARVFEVLSYG
jgi:hypothetical protein